MDKDQIENLILCHYNKRHFFDPYARGKNAEALAEHLVAKLGPTYDEVVGVMLDLKQQDGGVFYIKQCWNGAGAVHNTMGRSVVSWPASDTPGKDAVAAIEAAMKPEPTENEKALEALAQIEAAPCSLEPRIAIIRKALESKP